jgi:hypothetical protein
MLNIKIDDLEMFYPFLCACALITIFKKSKNLAKILHMIQTFFFSSTTPVCFRRDSKKKKKIRL